MCFHCAAYSGVGHQNGKLFPASDSILDNMTAMSPGAVTSSTPSAGKHNHKLEREKSSDSGGEGGENVLFALPEQLKTKPYTRHQSNMSTTSGDSGFHDNVITFKSQTSGGSSVDTHAQNDKDDVSMDIDDIDRAGSPDHQQMNGAETLDNGAESQQAQSPDSAMSDEQTSQRLNREAKPDRSNMRLDLPPSPLRVDRHLSKSPSEPALRHMLRDHTHSIRSNTTTPGYVFCF